MRANLKISFFIATLLLCLSFISFAQDLTGTWEGVQKINDKKYKYTFYLYRCKGGNGEYAVVLEIKEHKSLLDNVSSSLKVASAALELTSSSLEAVSRAASGRTINNIRIRTKLDKREKVTIRYIGSFIGGNFKLGDLAVIEQQDTKNDFQSSTETYKYQKSGNKETLIIDDETKFELTKEDTKFPSKYLNYAQYSNLASLQSINYANKDLLNKVKYNDKGTISFEFMNNSDIDIRAIKVVVSEQGQSNDIIFIDDSTRTFYTEKYQKLKGTINIHAGFRIPEDSVRFVINAYYQGNIPLFSKKFAVSTIPFFLSSKITSNNTSETLTALQGYCGFNKAKYSSPIEKLSILSTKGNKYATFWKGLLLFRGLNGLGTNAAKGLEIAKNSYNDILAGARNGEAEALYLMYQAVRIGLSGGEVKNISLEFLQKSADAGFAPAKYDFATYLLIQKQYKESFDIFSGLYNTGMEKSALRLGYFYQKGFFVNKSIDKAVEWYNKGLAFGDPEAMLALAELYDSEDTTPDMVKAVNYAQKAATLKNIDAINFLAHTYRYGKGAIQKNTPKAMAYYKEAADLGDPKAANVLASEASYQRVVTKHSNFAENSNHNNCLSLKDTTTREYYTYQEKVWYTVPFYQIDEKRWVLEDDYRYETRTDYRIIIIKDFKNSCSKTVVIKGLKKFVKDGELFYEDASITLAPNETTQYVNFEKNSDYRAAPEGTTYYGVAVVDKK
jgi:hypothetical protein